MEDILIPIAEIYVPAKRKHDIDPDKVDEIAGSILEDGQRMPIAVRRDGTGRGTDPGHRCPRPAALVYVLRHGAGPRRFDASRKCKKHPTP